MVKSILKPPPRSRAPRFHVHTTLNWSLHYDTRQSEIMKKDQAASAEWGSLIMISSSFESGNNERKADGEEEDERWRRRACWASDGGAEDKTAFGGASSSSSRGIYYSEAMNHGAACRGGREAVRARHTPTQRQSLNAARQHGTPQFAAAGTSCSRLMEEAGGVLQMTQPGRRSSNKQQPGVQPILNIHL